MSSVLNAPARRYLAESLALVGAVLLALVPVAVANVGPAGWTPIAALATVAIGCLVGGGIMLTRLS